MIRILSYIPILILLSWIAVILLQPLLALNPNDINLEHILGKPGDSTWLGEDDLGRPIADRLLIGAQVSLLVAFSVMIVTLVIGTVIGIASAWLGGWVDQLVMRITDVFLAFPGILLAIALAGLLGPGVGNVVLALSIVGWVGFARLARGQTLLLKNRDHVVAARSLGTSSSKIILWHLLPLIAAPLIIEATFAVAGLIIAEAGLSFLGLGVQAPSASWGSMIRDGARYLLVAPHLVIIPAVALFSIVMAINLLGDQLRDRLDVRT